VVFIDGGYLAKILRDQFGGAHLDFQKFSDNICNSIGVSRMRTYYYTCLPIKRKGNKDDEKRYSNAQKFLDKLKRLPRFEVRLGRLQNINGVFKQKMVDVNMSLDIVDICFDRQVDHIIIVAGDSDFIPAISRAKKYGVIVHLFYHPSSVHKHVLDEVDEIHELANDLIAESKLS